MHTGKSYKLFEFLGTATAFIVGFKNVQSYNRTWEARHIWGDIISGSRAWGAMSRDYFDDADKSKELVYRHLAWLTALRGHRFLFHQTVLPSASLRFAQGI